MTNAAEHPDLRATRDCLCLASRRAARTITRAFDRQLRPHGLRATQFTLLSNLAQRGAMPIGALAEILGVERTTLTRNLALLEAEGWVTVRAGEEDARARIVRITPKGQGAMTSALPAWRAAQAMAADAIGKAGVDALHSLARSKV